MRSSEFGLVNNVGIVLFLSVTALGIMYETESLSNLAEDRGSPVRLHFDGIRDTVPHCIGVRRHRLPSRQSRQMLKLRDGDYLTLRSGYTAKVFNFYDFPSFRFWLQFHFQLSFDGCGLLQRVLHIN